MQVHQAHPAGWISYAITAAIIAVVFAVRWKRMSRVRPLKLERLWVFPALYLVVAVVTVAQFPPVGWAWAFCLIALVLGAALGWQRGKLMRISVDPATHALNQTSSPAAVLFLVAIVAVRSGARALLVDGANPYLGALHLNALAVTDMLIALALGLFIAQRLEMYLRGKRLLAMARAQTIA